MLQSQRASGVRGINSLPSNDRRRRPWASIPVAGMLGPLPNNCFFFIETQTLKKVTNFLSRGGAASLSHRFLSLVSLSLSSLEG